MSRLATELANKLFDGLSAVKEAAVAVAPGLSNFGQEVKAEMKQQAAHGAHELAAALFNGSAFVMYPRNSGKDDHGVSGPDQSPGHDQGQQQDSPTLERHGRSM